jgi:hypothetical protein
VRDRRVDVPGRTLTRATDADDLTWVGGPVTPQQARILAVLARAAPDPVAVTRAP